MTRIKRKSKAEIKITAQPVAFKITHGINYLRENINKDHFKGIVISVILFEVYAYNELKKYLDSKNVPIEVFDIRTLNDIMDILKNLEIINSEIKNKMMEVMRFRNAIIHSKEFSLRFPELIEDSIDKDKAEEMIKIAIECLQYFEKIRS